MSDIVASGPPRAAAPTAGRPAVKADRAGPPLWVTVPAAAAFVMLPFLHPSGPGNSSPVDLFMGATIVATLVWAVRSGIKLHAPFVFAEGTIIVAGAIAGLTGNYGSISLLELVQDIYLLAWCISLVNIARYPGVLRLLLRAWSGGAIAWAAILIPTYFLHITAVSGVTATEGPRASLFAGDPNLLASYFVTSIMVTVATGFPSNRVLRLVGLAVLLGGLALTFSNGGLIAVCIGGALIIGIRLVRRYGAVAIVPPLAALTVLVGGALLFGLSLSSIQAWASTSNQTIIADTLGRSNQSAWERSTLFQESFDLYYQHGWLGVGPLATINSLEDELAPYPNEAHDDYFAAVIEGGVLGGVGMVILIGSVGWRVRTLLRGRTRPAFLAAVQSPEALAGAVLAMAFFATTEEILHFRQTWALFAVVAAYHLWAGES